MFGPKKLKLTWRQYDVLREINSGKRGACGRSITNPTLNALMRRGLVSVEVSRDPEFQCLKETWSITPEGRVALTPEKKD